MGKKILFGGILAAALVLSAGLYLANNQSIFFRPTSSEIPDAVAPDKEVVAENLNIPWEILFLPDGAMLVTERAGNLLLIKKDKTIIPIEGVRHFGEGGLLGAALDPEFADNHFIYLYLTTQGESGVQNRVEKYVLENNELTDRELILEGIPGAVYHDGGKIAFGPDGHLYITTGDATVSQNAQNARSLAGKILRLNDEGEAEIFSYGHRNPQGLAWDDDGNLWATEHGRSGAFSGYDEVNLIEKGKNYGWPQIQGDEKAEGMVAPVANSGPNETWAPASILYYKGSLFFTGLRGEALYQAILDGTEIVELKAHLRGEYGRLRALTLGPDDYFYISTSNMDGRGKPRGADDKIIRINPETLLK